MGGCARVRRTKASAPSSDASRVVRSGKTCRKMGLSDLPTSSTCPRSVMSRSSAGISARTLTSPNINAHTITATFQLPTTHLSGSTMGKQQKQKAKYLPNDSLVTNGHKLNVGIITRIGVLEVLSGIWRTHAEVGSLKMKQNSLGD